LASLAILAPMLLKVYEDLIEAVLPCCLEAPLRDSLSIFSSLRSGADEDRVDRKPAQFAS